MYPEESQEGKSSPQTTTCDTIVESTKNSESLKVEAKPCEII